MSRTTAAHLKAAWELGAKALWASSVQIPELAVDGC